MEPQSRAVDGPSLHDARWRLDVAGQRLRTFEKEARQVSAVTAGLRLTIPRKMYEEGDLTPTIDWGGAQPRYSPYAAQLAASECLHHLRCALEHVAFNLSWLDSGRERTHTKFPVVTDPSMWPRESRSGLKGVSVEHREALKQFQPFAGPTWLSDLAKLSNDDKHRFLVDMYREHSVRTDFSRVSTDPDHPETLIVAVDEVESSLRLRGVDGVSLLRELLGGCRQVVQTLAPAFEQPSG